MNKISPSYQSLAVHYSDADRKQAMLEQLERAAYQKEVAGVSPNASMINRQAPGLSPSIL